MDYDSAGDSDDESVTLKLSEERSAGFPGSEDESEDTVRGLNVMVRSIFALAPPEIRLCHTSQTVLPSWIMTQLRTPMTNL